MSTIKYLPLDKVRVFPISSNITNSDGVSYAFRQLSEGNLSSLLSSATDRDSYVITRSIYNEEGEIERPVEIEFVIGGHYLWASFDEDYLEDFVSDGKGAVFATVLIAPTFQPSSGNAIRDSHMTVDVKTVEVQGGGKVDYFTGIQFTTTNEPKLPGDLLKSILKDGETGADITSADGVIDGDYSNNTYIEIHPNYFDGSNSNVKVKTLQLLAYTNGKWEIPQDSLVKINYKSIDEIDGGIID